MALIANQDPSSGYSGKKVFVTGHTGFTGVWMCHWLLEAGADVYGYSLAPEEWMTLNMFDHSGLADRMTSTIGDIRDVTALNSAMLSAGAEIVFHLAAQPIVRLSYEEPEMTYETNVMGTLNVLKTAQKSGAKTLVNITSDKAYKNKEWVWGYRENDEMGGHDMYSSSKACADILAKSYWLSFCQDEGAMRLATGRAGNIIGGGDWARDRLIPDIARAYSKNEKVIIRRPEAVRPWQHVMEAVRGYLQIGNALADGRFNGDAINFGPQPENMVPVGDLAEKMTHYMSPDMIEINPASSTLHEANLLRLDITRARVELGWAPALNFDETVELTSRFYKEMITDPSSTRSLLENDLAYLRAKLKS